VQVNLRVLDRESGEPKKGRTQRHIVMRQLSTKPGAVYSLRQARRDIDAVYSMGIMEDVNMLPQVCAHAAAVPAVGESRGGQSDARGVGGKRPSPHRYVRERRQALRAA
jgi:hypothetical protein